MITVKYFLYNHGFMFGFCLIFGVCKSLDVPSPTGMVMDLEGYVLNKTNPEEFTFRNVCYPDIGCFDNGPPFFDPTSRPISSVPRECNETKLPLFTPDNPKNPYNLTLKKGSVENSPIRCDLPTKVISHGFIANNKAYLEMKDAILSIGEFNIIVPDYADCTLPPYYQAVANMRTVGARVAKLMQNIMNYCNVDPTWFHLIGHSLGSHMSGYAAKRVGKVARISGLDVAGPYFQGASNETRLTKDDAYFVDAIHTNAGKTIMEYAFGSFDPVGHMDYWANNGHIQPGCNPIKNAAKLEGFLNYTKIFLSVGCSHSRSSDLYTESINSTDCIFKGVLCSSYKDFSDGKCPTAEMPISVLMYHARRQHNMPVGSTFYFTTSDQKPFCMKKGAKPPEQSWMTFLNFFNRFFRR